MINEDTLEFAPTNHKDKRIKDLEEQVSYLENRSLQQIDEIDGLKKALIEVSFKPADQLPYKAETPLGIISDNDYFNMSQNKSYHIVRG